MNNHAVRLLKEALSVLEEGDAKRAAWRVADAGLMLREQIEKSGEDHSNMIGMSVPTGLGAVLPRKINRLESVK